MSFIAGTGKTNVDILYASLKRLPQLGEELYSDGFKLCLGGGVPGTMVNLGRLNIPVRTATWLGLDMFSDFASNEYRDNSVEITNLYEGGVLPLNITSAMITPEDRTFVTYGPDAEENDVTAEKIYRMSTGAKIVEVQNGYYDVYRKLKDEGTLLVLDTGYTDDMSLSLYRDLIELCDYYVPNQKEAMKITETASPEDAISVLSRYFENPMVKLDKDGCMGMEGGKVFTVPVIDEYVRVDSTGAGDAFLAGFMYGLFNDTRFRACILLGNLTGGKCVTGVGCLTEYLTEEELLKKFNEYKAEFFE